MRGGGASRGASTVARHLAPGAAFARPLETKPEAREKTPPLPVTTLIAIPRAVLEGLVATGAGKR